MSNGDLKTIDIVLANDINYVDSILRVKDSVREEIVKTVREIVRYSSDSIRFVHLGEYGKARELLDKLIKIVRNMCEKLSQHPDLYYSGLVYNGLSEFVEAYLTYSLIVEEKLVSIRELNIPIAPYLQGLGDLIGELRRYVLTLIDRNEFDKANLYLNIMETIYSYLKKLNYPDPLVPGLKHRVDVARRLIEDTKTLFISVKNMIDLSKKLSLNS
ncbi:MAG: haloacid dehalogenase [Desulfurococcaceae archaeon]